MMKALCGEDAFANLAVVTTMWSSHESELLKQQHCEQELQDVYLRDMIVGGARVIRHD